MKGEIKPWEKYMYLWVIFSIWRKKALAKKGKLDNSYYIKNKNSFSLNNIISKA